MTPDPLDRIRSVRDIPALIAYLRDELDWPIEADDFDELTFDYEPEELGIDANTAAKIEEIKQLRPLAGNQPWGVFFIRFEPKRLPVVVLRRILSQLVVRKRASAKKSDLAAWNLHDLLFISNYGEGADRQITFAHFTQDTASGDLPTLKVLGWDDADTALHISHVQHELQEKLRWPEDEKDLDGWRERWSSAFTLRHRQVITTSKDLAVRLAVLAKSIRRRADQVLTVETERGPLRKLHKAFRAALLHDLSEEDFADMYAQTIAYGLLAARVSRPMGIIAENVTDMVPVTNPFLREMLGTFLTIGGRKGKMDFDELGVQDVVDLLNSRDTHMEAILRDFGNRTRQEDPVIHFYELFLAEYDKKMKVKRGVFYTPQPVVSYIVRSVQELLQTEFGLAYGLADTTTWGEMAARYAEIKIPDSVTPDTPFVQILDPATGTATFLVEVIDIVHKTITAKWRREGRMELEFNSLWNEYVPKHLLPRLYGYELMMAPYAIAHMKIGLKLYETGYRFGSDERAHVYLTNALEPPQDFSDRLAFDAPALAHEARAVNAVKRYKRFTVVIGNPPYAKSSSNRSDAAESLVAEYKRLVHGEVNVQPLSDDYVKFLAFSLEASVRSASVIGMITNRSYLEGLIHRGMRSVLCDSCSTIVVVDLHGDSNVGERRPPGRENENVFDIMQGVAISIFVRSPGDSAACILRKDVWGTREEKYQALERGDARTEADVLSLSGPYWFFAIKDLNSQSEQVSWVSVDDLFHVAGMGVKSRRDHFLIDEHRNVLSARMAKLASVGNVESLRRELQVTDNPQWTLDRMRELLRREGVDDQIVAVTYRPFDVRFIWYHREAIERGDARWPVMKHVLPDGLSLLTSRQSVNHDFSSVFIARGLSEMKTAESTRGSYVFPIRYAEDTQLLGAQSTTSNIRADVLGAGLSIRSPEEILGYVYSVLHSVAYRRRYAGALRIEFPRIPRECPRDLADRLCCLGEELIGLHLLESPKLDRFITTYIGPKNPEVVRVGWSDDTVWLDAVKPKKGATDAKVTGTVGFRGVPEEVWNFHIGGYQVCEKWLKYRKGRTLVADDLVHYHRIIVALHETIRLMAEIDRVIDAHGGWPEAFMANKL